MKLLNNLSLLASVIFVAVSCSTSTKSSDDKSSDDQEDCIYTYNTSSLDFKWTAYKFTTKKGVPGTFDEIAVTSGDAATSIDELLQSVKFKINTGSINSNAPVRDVKIAEFFFGTMANTSEITGSIKSVVDGKAIISLTINEMTLDVPGTIALSGDTIKLTATVDFKEFGGEEAVAKLNEVCSELHTGEDGESVFWDVVDINVSALYSKRCN